MKAFKNFIATVARYFSEDLALKTGFKGSVKTKKLTDQ
jgi:hypothetical protein